MGYRFIIFVTFMTFGLLSAYIYEQDCISKEDVIVADCTNNVSITFVQESLQPSRDDIKRSFQYHYVINTKVGNYGNFTDHIMKWSSEYHPKTISSTITEKCYILGYYGEFTPQMLHYHNPATCGRHYAAVTIVSFFMIYMLLIWGSDCI